MTDFVFETTVPVRHTDRDRLGHVNNAIYATYLEEGRLAYFEEGLGRPLDERSMLIASLSIDFESQIRRGPVTVGLEIVAIGESSFDFEYEVAVDGETAATARSVQVAYDLEQGQKIAFPEEWHTAVAELQGRVPDR